MIALTSKRASGTVTSFNITTKAEHVGSLSVCWPWMGLMTESVCVADFKTPTEMQIWLTELTQTSLVFMFEMGISFLLRIHNVGTAISTGINKSNRA